MEASRGVVRVGWRVLGPLLVGMLLAAAVAKPPPARTCIVPTPSAPAVTPPTKERSSGTGSRRGRCSPPISRSNVWRALVGTDIEVSDHFIVEADWISGAQNSVSLGGVFVINSTTASLRRSCARTIGTA